MSFDKLREKYMSNVLESSEPKTNVLDQLPSYNSYETDLLISTLNVEYEEQCMLNKLLSEENSSDNAEKIEKFINENKEKIDSQVESLEEITKNLKDVCKKNKALELDKEEYQQIVNSEEYRVIGEKMKKLKTLKTDILHFLDKAGLGVQP